MKSRTFWVIYEHHLPLRFHLIHSYCSLDLLPDIFGYRHFRWNELVFLSFTLEHSPPNGV